MGRILYYGSCYMVSVFLATRMQYLEPSLGKMTMAACVFIAFLVYSTAYGRSRFPAAP